MFGLKLIHIHGNDSWGAWVTRPIVAMIRPTSLAIVAFVVLLVSFVRRELASVRKFAISLIMRHLRMLQTAMLLAAACMVGCDTAKPEKFAGFASEQLSEQIESVSAKLDESIEENHLAQTEILRAVKDLSETVAGMQLTSQKQIEELKKVSTKAKVKLTSAGDEKEGVATLDPNGAPSAKLQLDSLDDAAAQIEALVKRIDELEKRCNSFASAAPKSSSGGGSTGSLKSSSGGCTGTLQASSYQAPVYSYETVQYSQPAYSQPVYSTPVYSETIQPSQPVFQSSESSTCYVDPVTGQTVCNRNMSQSLTQPVKRGLFGGRGLFR